MVGVLMVSMLMVGVLVVGVLIGVLVVSVLMVGVLMVGVGGRGRRSGTAVSTGNCVIEGELLKTLELQMDYVSRFDRHCEDLQWVP